MLWQLNCESVAVIIVDLDMVGRVVIVKVAPIRSFFTAARSETFHDSLFWAHFSFYVNCHIQRELVALPM
jgi:hypothetical protein